jgi:hypothetical protein
MSFRSAMVVGKVALILKSVLIDLDIPKERLRLM